jgi:hypothetical protein
MFDVSAMLAFSFPACSIDRIDRLFGLRDVQADRMAGGMESGSKEPAEPPRGTGEQNAH